MIIALQLRDCGRQGRRNATIIYVTTQSHSIKMFCCGEPMVAHLVAIQWDGSEINRQSRAIAWVVCRSQPHKCVWNSLHILHSRSLKIPSKKNLFVIWNEHITIKKYRRPCWPKGIDISAERMLTRARKHLTCTPIDLFASFWRKCGTVLHSREH